jgi:hypothetical protein
MFTLILNLCFICIKYDCVSSCTNENKLVDGGVRGAIGYNLPEMSALFLLIYLNKCTSSNRTNIYKHALFYLHQSPLTKTHANYLVQIERNVLCHKIFSGSTKSERI